jgi:hypothetical protein
VNPYTEALKVLDGGNNWGQGSFVDYNDCMISAIGAVSRKFYDNDAILLMDGTCELPERIAEELFPGRGAQDALYIFNDHEDTTWDDVRVVFEKAAVEYDARA